MMDTVKRLDTYKIKLYLRITFKDIVTVFTSKDKTTRSTRASCIKNRIYAFLPKTKDYNGRLRVNEYHVNYKSLWELLFLQDEIFRNEEYRFTENIQNPLIIDCGSNIGMSILYFKTRHSSARIIGFEPNRKIYNILLKNLHENELTDVVVNNLALAGHNGHIEFFESDTETLDNSIVTDENKKKVRVECVKLSEYIHEKVNLLKMDVEGAEEDVIEDLINTKKIRLVDKIFMEYHLLPDRRLGLEGMIKSLKKHGFKVNVRSNDPVHVQTPKFYQYLISAER